MKENTFAPEESTEDFGSNSLEENSKLAEKLTDTGFNSVKETSEVKDFMTDNSPIPDGKISYDDEIWKYRYYKLLEVINTFKGSNYE